MIKYKKILKGFLPALFGFLVGIYTKGSYMGLLIIAIAFLLIYLIKTFILKNK